MAYRDLLTHDRLVAADTGKTVTGLPTMRDEATAVIQGVSSLLRSRLGRVLIAEVVTQRVAPHHWRQDETAPGSQVWTYADHPPVVQAGPKVEKQTGCRLTAPRPYAGKIMYVAGFRRPSQVFTPPEGLESAFPAGTPSGMSNLTTLPPVLPAEIQEMAINITLHVLDARGDELGRRTTRQIGGQQLVVEGADPAYLERQLDRLGPHDRSHVPKGPTETQPLTEA